MKKRTIILRIVLSFILIVGIVFVCSIVCRHPSYEIEDTVNGYSKEPENSLDYIVVGSSGGNKAVLPTMIWEKTGATGYNYSIVTAVGNIYHSILNEALSKQDNPVVFVDTDGFLVPDYYLTNKDSVRMWCDSMPRNKNWFSTVNTVAKDSRFERYFTFSRYHRYMTSLYSYLPITVKEYKNKILGITNPLKGAVVLTGTHDPGIYWENQINDGISEKPEPVTYGYFKDFLNACKENGLENVVFVNFPKSSFSLSDKERNTLYCHRFNYLKKDIENSGYSYIDLCDKNSGLNLTLNDFCDSAHLYYPGAVKVSDYISEYLKSNFTFKEKSDEVKEIWEKDSQLFKESYGG